MKSFLKRSILISITMLLSFTSMITNIFALDEPIGTIQINVEGLRIRKDADTSSDFIGGVEEGKTYTVYAKKENNGYTWYQIEEGQWVADNGSWVTFTASEQTNETVSSDGTSSANSVYVKVSRLRIRTDASTDAAVTGYVDEGQQYAVSEIKSDGTYIWYHITSGWIADRDGSWVDYTGSTSATAAEDTSSATETVSNTLNGYVTVNVSRLRIRTDASVNSDQVGYAEEGMTYSASEKKDGDGYTWYHIESGWIADRNNLWVSYSETTSEQSSANETSSNSSSSSAATETATTAQSSNAIGTAKVNVEQLNIRSYASTSASSAGYAEYGKTYSVLSQTTNGGYTWYQIGEGQWIADVSGKWVTYTGQGQSASTVSTTAAVVKGSASNPYSGGWSNCTWSAWYLVYTNKGIALPNMGSASNWLNAAQSLGYSTGTTPKVGAIAVYSYHVAYVTAVQFNTITIEEGGYLGAHNIRNVSWSSDGTQALQGYIYLD